MRDFICVSCWTSFQVDESLLVGQDTVTCPKCGNRQPARKSSGGAAKPAPELTPLPDEAASTMHMPLPASLMQEVAEGKAKLDMPAGYGGGSGGGGGSGSSVQVGEAQEGAEDEFAATMEMGLPPDLMAKLQAQSPFGDDLDVPGKAAPATNHTATPDAAAKGKPERRPTISWGDPIPKMPRQAPNAPAPQPAPPEPPPSAPAEPPPQAGGQGQPIAAGTGDSPPQPGAPDVAVWRMKLPSGLVLTFPTIEMVQAWAKDRDQGTLQIAYGTTPFQPYLDFLDAYEEIGNAVQAMSDLIGDKPKPTRTRSQTGVATVDDPSAAAAAAAAAAARASGERPVRPTQLKFRTAPPPSPWPKRIMWIVALTLLLGGGAVGVLIWQGII